MNSTMSSTTRLIVVAVMTAAAGCQSLCGKDCGGTLFPFRKPLPVAYWFVNPSKACCLKKQITLGRYWDFFDAWYVKDRARKCGMAAIKRMVKETGCVPDVDYRRGFVQAYIDIAMGSDGQLPPVPPQDYWGAFGRSRTGHERAAEWFRGYADGVAQARSCDLEHFGTVPTSIAGTHAEAVDGIEARPVCPDGRCGVSADIGSRFQAANVWEPAPWDGFGYSTGQLPIDAVTTPSDGASFGAAGANGAAAASPMWSAPAGARPATPPTDSARLAPMASPAPLPDRASVPPATDTPPFGDGPPSHVAPMSYVGPATAGAGGRFRDSPESAAAAAPPPLWPYAPQPHATTP